MDDRTSAGRLIYEEAKAAHAGTDTIIAMLEDDGDGDSPLTKVVELLETIAASQATILQEIAALRGEGRTVSLPPA